MKIIALHGKASCGKTTTIKKLYAKLVCDNRFSQMLFKKEGKDDLTAVFEYGTKKVGVTSLGDGEAELKNAFDIFIAENCDIVVCACRTRDAKNGAIAYIKSLNVNVAWYKKAYIDVWTTQYYPTNEIDKINDIQAEALVKEVVA